MFWFQGQSNECDFKILILSYQASEKEKKGLSNIFMKFDIVFKYSRPKKKLLHEVKILVSVQN